MSDHTITVEITVEAESRKEAHTLITFGLNHALWGQPKIVNHRIERWSFATHERPDLPSTTSTYSLARAAQI